MENATAVPDGRPLVVERWPTEIPLLVLVVVASLGIWMMLVLSIIGVIYALAIVLFLFFAHIAFVTHLRGSGVKLGPEQFPQLHSRVVELARRAGLDPVPDAYLLESGGALNALATKLFRGRMIVLFSDLLDACGDDEAARDMVIGHELGHLKCGHLDWTPFVAPGSFVPFLGSAYSRARELTCDRWGAALCGDADGAARGLAILAAGGRHGPQVNLRAFVSQRRDLDTGWLTLGSWLARYPPLSARVAAVRPTLAPEPWLSSRGPLRAAGILAALVIVPTALTMGAAFVWIKAMKPVLDGASQETDYAALVEAANAGEGAAAPVVADVEAATRQANADLAALAEVVREAGTAIADEESLQQLWHRHRPGAEYPTDPFDGAAYGVVDLGDGGVLLYSSGPDGEPSTGDDIDVEVDTLTSN